MAPPLLDPPPPSRGTPSLDCRTATQFSRVIASELEDQTRAAMERFVGDIGADEVMDMARHLAQMKGRFLAQALAVCTNRQPPSKEETDELKVLREQIVEVEQAFHAVRDAIAAEQVPVREIAGTSASKAALLRRRPA